MSDPLSDPRAADLLSADPGEVWALAITFRQVAGEASTAAAGLRGAQHDAHWTGAAAAAFRRNLGQLPGELDKIHQSYVDVAGALDAYETELSSVQPAFQQLSSQLGAERTSLAGAQGQLHTAQGNFAHALDAPNAKPNSPAVQNAQHAYLGAVGNVGRLQGEVGGLESQGFRLLDRFEHARDAAKAKVSSAAGIAPHQSWWDHVMSDVGNWMHDVGHWVSVGAIDVGHWGKVIGVDAFNIGKGIVMGVVHSAESLPSDVVNVYEHPTDLHDWAKLAEDTGTVAGAVALVAAVLICPADAIGLEAAVDVFEVVDGVASDAALASSVAKTGFDTGLAEEGQGSWATVGFDAAGVASSEVHVPGLKGARNSEDFFTKKSAGLEQYGLDRALGATHEQAYADLSAAQREVLTQSAAKLSNAEVRSSAIEAKEAAEIHLHRVEAVDEGAHFVYDKSSEAVKAAVVGDSGGS